MLRRVTFLKKIQPAQACKCTLSYQHTSYDASFIGFRLAAAILKILRCVHFLLFTGRIFIRPAQSGASALDASHHVLNCQHAPHDASFIGFRLAAAILKMLRRARFFIIHRTIQPTQPYASALDASHHVLNCQHAPHDASFIIFRLAGLFLKCYDVLINITRFFQSSLGFSGAFEHTKSAFVLANRPKLRGGQGGLGRKPWRPVAQA
jgi:hypothetical protein